MPDNLQDFTTMYMQRPVAKIIEELFILKTNSRELKVTNQKLAKNDPTKLKDEIKRLQISAAESSPVPPADDCPEGGGALQGLWEMLY